MSIPIQNQSGTLNIVIPSISYPSGSTLYFPSGANPDLTSVTIDVSSGAQVILGDLDNASDLPCPVSITVSVNTNVTMIGEIDFKDRVLVTLPTKFNLGTVPTLNFGSNTSAATVTFANKNSGDGHYPLEFKNSKGAVTINNNGTELYFHVDPSTGCIENFNLPLTQASHVTGTHLTYIIGQNVIDHYDALDPNTYAHTGAAYDLWFAGTTVIDGVDYPICPFSVLDPPPAALKIHIMNLSDGAPNVVSFDFTNYYVYPAANGEITFPLDISVGVDCCANISHAIIDADTDRQTLYLRGPGNLVLVEEGEEPHRVSTVSLRPLENGIVNIDFNGGDYGTIYGNPYVLLAPGNYYASTNTEEYGIDPTIIYGRFTFQLEGGGDYSFPLSTTGPLHIQLLGNSTIVDSSLSNGMIIEFNNHELELSGCIIGACSLINPSIYNDHTYLIYSPDDEFYSSNLTLTNTVLKIGNSCNFIIPEIEVSVDEASRLRMCEGTFNMAFSTVENQGLSDVPTELTTENGLYSFQPVSGGILNTVAMESVTISGSVVYSQLKVDSTEYNVETAGNVYHSSTDYNTPLVLTGNDTTLSEATPDTWYMSTVRPNTAHPYEGEFSGGSHRNGVLLIGTGGGGTFDASHGSWYGIHAYLVDPSGCMYVFDQVGYTEFDGSLYGLELETSSEYAADATYRLSFNTSAGITLQPEDGSVFDISHSSIYSGPLPYALTMRGTSVGSLQTRGTTALYAMEGNGTYSNPGEAAQYVLTTGPYVQPTLVYCGSDTETYDIAEHDHELEVISGIYLMPLAGSQVFQLITPSLYDEDNERFYIYSNSSIGNTATTLRSGQFNHWTVYTTDVPTTLEGNVYNYVSGDSTLEVHGNATVTVVDGSLHINSSVTVERLFTLGSSDESLNFVVNRPPTITEESGASYKYGIFADTRGTINTSGMTLDPNNLEVYWPNLSNLSVAQPYLCSADRDYVAYSYDCVGEAAAVDLDSWSGTSDVLWAFCVGSPTLPSQSITVSLNTVYTSVGSTSDYEDFDSGYYGYQVDGVDGRTVTHSGFVGGNALHRGTIRINSTNIYIPDLTVHADVSCTREIIPFVYTVNQTSGYGGDEPYIYIDDTALLDACGNAGDIFTVYLNRPCSFDIWIYPSDRSDSIQYEINDIIRSGPDATRSVVKYQDVSNNYLTYDQYTGAGRAAAKKISAYQEQVEMTMLYDPTNTLYFRNGIVAFDGHTSRTYGEGQVYRAEHDWDWPSSRESNFLFVDLDTSIGANPLIWRNGVYLTTDEPTLYDSYDDNENTAQLGVLHINSANYSDATVTYDVSVRLHSSAIGSHVLYISANDTNPEGFDFSVSTVDGGVTIGTDGGSYTATYSGTGDHELMFHFVTNRPLDQYEFMQQVTANITLEDTAAIESVDDVPLGQTTYLRTYFYLPPVILVGVATEQLGPGDLDQMHYLYNNSEAANAEARPLIDRGDSVYYTFMTVGTPNAGGLNLWVGLYSDISVSDMGPFNFGPDGQYSGFELDYNIFSEHGYYGHWQYEIPQFSETLHAIDNSLDIELTVANHRSWAAFGHYTTYYSSYDQYFEFNGDNSMNALQTAYYVSWLTDFDDERTIVGTVSVGPAADVGYGTLTEQAGSGDWVSSETTIYPTSRIYEIALTVSLSSIPYNAYTDGNNTTIRLYPAFYDENNQRLDLNEGEGVYMYSNNSLTDLVTSVEIGGQEEVTLYLNLSHLTAEFVSIRFEDDSDDNNEDTDYYSLEDSSGSLVTISYSGLPFGEVAALVFNLGNWTIRSNPDGDLLFQYSVLKVDGENDVLASYILPHTTVPSNLITTEAL